jgi:mRNA-degrading endonuclease toxin of MazEF toxin-antitoxin module
MRVDLKTKPTIREKKEKRKAWGAKYSAAENKVTKPEQVDCPDRMEIVFRDNPLNRWLCLTPKAWNMHVGYFVAVPVTVERTKLDPFEYNFLLDKVSQIALCAQPQSLPIKPPYLSMGKLSRGDHAQISKTMAKLLFDPSIGDSL